MTYICIPAKIICGNSDSAMIHLRKHSPFTLHPTHQNPPQTYPSASGIDSEFCPGPPLEHTPQTLYSPPYWPNMSK